VRSTGAPPRVLGILAELVPLPENRVSLADYATSVLEQVWHAAGTIMALADRSSRLV
jgi:hypothetical protein